MESFEKATSVEAIKQRRRLVVYLGARMHETNTAYEDGKTKWAFPLFTPNQANTGTPLPGEVSGGFSRQEAVRKLYEQAHDRGEEMTVLATSGNEKTGASRSEEAVHRFIATEGLAEADVVSIGGVGSTLGNAGATFKYINEHQEELGDVSKVEIVTNDFHMLRSWIMFSQAILELSNNEQLQVTQEDKDAIYAILKAGTPQEGIEFDTAMVAKTRTEVMDILKKYFATSKIEVVPRVVEEVLDDGTDAEQRYARMLRSNEWTIKTIQFEYKGIKDLLEGRYKGK